MKDFFKRDHDDVIERIAEQSHAETSSMVKAAHRSIGQILRKREKPAPKIPAA